MPARSNPPRDPASGAILAPVWSAIGPFLEHPSRVGELSPIHVVRIFRRATCSSPVVPGPTGPIARGTVGLSVRLLEEILEQ